MAVPVLARRGEVRGDPPVLVSVFEWIEEPREVKTDNRAESDDRQERDTHNEVLGLANPTNDPPQTLKLRFRSLRGVFRHPGLNRAVCGTKSGFGT